MSEVQSNNFGAERRQSRFLIEKNFQNRLTLKICLYAGGLVLMYGVLLLFMIHLNYEMLLQNAMASMPSAIESLKREYQFYSILLILVLLLVIAFLYGIGLLITQKIAGPLIAVQKRLRDFGDGKSGVRLRLRRQDEFKNIESIFNYAMESFDHRQANEIKELETAQRMIQANNPTEAIKIIERVLKAKTEVEQTNTQPKIKIPGESL